MCYLLGLRDERRVIFHESGYVDTMVARRSKKELTKKKKKKKDGLRVHERFHNSFLGNYGSSNELTLFF